jgi:chromosomal replication initiation ATPase DnaA
MVLVYDRSRAPAKRIIDQTAREHSLSYDDLVGRSRKLPIVRARHAAMAALWSPMGYSISQIARFFNRDHSTARHGILRHRSLKELANGAA